MTAGSAGAQHGNPLLELLADCVVRIDCEGAFAATGFFVAPGEILTCAHVVHGCERPSVSWAGEQRAVAAVEAVPDLAPDDETAAFYPLPDLALLALEDAFEHPCVLLGERLPAADVVVRLCAFTKGEHAAGAVARSAASTVYEGSLTEDEETLLKLRDGQILGGFSGGPLLDVGGGAVCGVVESSRDARSALGGFGVPVASVLATFDGLKDRNAAFHDRDERWERAVEAERVAERTRASGFRSLPLRSGAAPALAKDASPSAVLLPRRRVVPLVGREELLARFMLWRERDDPLSIAIVAGAGGYGKTRLAAELCLAAHDAGWTAGLLDPPDSEERAGETIDALAGWPGRLHVAIDYAETRPDLVNELLRTVRRYPDRLPVRIVLVVRQAGTRAAMRDLFVSRRVSEELADLYDAAQFVNLDASVHAVDRGVLFERAAAAFATHFESGPYAGRIPRLGADHFDRPLYVLVAASLAVRAPEVDPDALGERDLLLELLDRHEASYWERWDERLGVGLDERDRPAAVALAGLLGSSSEAETLALVRLVPGLGDATQERVRLAGRWLGSLYGAGDLDVVAPLEPDRLAEVLIGRALADAAAIGAALDAASPAQLARALNVLARAASEHERLRLAARAALDERLAGLARDLASTAAPDVELVAALRLVMQVVRPLAGASAASRELFDAGRTLGPFRVDVNELSVAASRALVEADADRLPDLAGSLNNLFAGLSDVGRAGEALAAIEEAVEHYRVLAAASAERFLPDLAMSLNNLFAGLRDVGRAGEALAAIEEAVEHYRVLAAASAERFLPDLAMSLNNLSAGLRDVGRADEALAAIEEAVEHYRVLAAASAERFLPDLAMSLNNLFAGLRDVGRADEALAAIEEAVKHYRVLAAASAERFLPDLAMSLNNLSAGLSDVGRAGEALAAIEEAVKHYRVLAAASAERFLPDLATSLNNLSAGLRDVGRAGEALAAIEEAVKHYRVLAAASAERFLPDLATSLNNLSNGLRDVGRADEALAAIEEAVKHYRVLAAASAERFLPNLAGSLNNLFAGLSDVGRADEALAAIEEAVKHYRVLAAASAERFLPDLAMSLNNLSAGLSDVGRADEALAAIEEAVKHYRVLAAASAERFLPDLAMSLNNLFAGLSDVGRADEALAAIEEAVKHYRVLAAASAERFLPDLATSLNNLSAGLRDVGRADEALAAIEEAVKHYRVLAAASAERFLPDLATSLNNLSGRLGEIGRAGEADALFAELLDEHADGWSAGVLRLSRASWHRRSGRLESAITDAWQAAGQIDVKRDARRRGQARKLLRSMRTDDPARFDEAWATAAATRQPGWLVHLDDQPATVKRLLAWIKTPGLDESEATLSTHADGLLTEPAEAALEHLVDANPGRETLVTHVAILQAARAAGVAATYADIRRQQRQAELAALLDGWLRLTDAQGSAYLGEHADVLLTDEAEGMLEADTRQAGAPRLTAALGLLGLCRSDGIEQAYALRATDSTLPEPDEPSRALAVARIRAGMHPGDVELLADHAVAAAAHGKPEEAAGAIAACRDAADAWELDAVDRRLAAVAAARPQLAGEMAALRQALSAPA